MKNQDEILTIVQGLQENHHLSNQGEVELLDGRAVERQTTPLFSKEGKYLGRVWFFRDITAQKEIEIKLKDLSFQYPLPGVANRRYFFERANLEVERSKRYSNPLPVGILDIDHFKQINDNYGHLMGDEVLKSVCVSISASLRQVDVFGRIDGSEIFA